MAEKKSAHYGPTDSPEAILLLLENLFEEIGVDKELEEKVREKLVAAGTIGNAVAEPAASYNASSGLSLLLRSMLRPYPLLSPHASGVIRIGHTRLRLDVVINAFNQGCSAEEIVMQFPTLDLAEAYEVIAFYLRNKEWVDAHVDNLRAIEEELEKQDYERYGVAELRNRLLARQASRQGKA